MTSGPAPSTAQCRRMPLVSTKRCSTAIAIGIARRPGGVNAAVRTHRRNLLGSRMPRASVRWAAAAAAVVAVAAYANTLGNGLVRDDDFAIVRNAAAHEPGDL